MTSAVPEASRPRPRSGPVARAFAPWPQFDVEDIRAATAVLESGRVNYWTGEEGRRFEEEFANAVGCRYGVALANGTVALEAALRAAGIGAGDDVVVTSRSFVASASSVAVVGARPVFADVDRVSQNLTAATIERALTPKTRAVIVVHLAGWPCEMAPIMELASARNLVVIEDCAQAHGAAYRGHPVGSLGHAAAWSFCQDKIMTTGGEGGMVTTNDRAIWEWVWSYKDHGKSYDAVYHRKHAPGYRWLHEGFGTNWRMTEFQAAMGRVMLRKLPGWVERRRRYAAMLTEGFSRVAGLRVTEPPADVHHSYYKYYVFVRPDRLRAGWSRDRIMAAVTAQGIPCFTGYSEMYLEKAFAGPGLHPEQPLPVARELGETGLQFLVHPTLAEADIAASIDAVTHVLGQAAV